MVVMDDVNDEYVGLFNLIRNNLSLLSERHLGSRNLLSEKVGQCLRQFHQAGFVHGDIRDTNIMVKTLNQGGFNDGSFLVVDYDSCGEMEQVRYPLNLNTTSVKDFSLVSKAIFVHSRCCEVLNWPRHQGHSLQSRLLFAKGQDDHDVRAGPSPDMALCPLSFVHENVKCKTTLLPLSFHPHRPPNF